jgi:hypothetical protein
MASSAEPPPARDRRPWECPGHIRRDCEPHRALLLSLLGIAALVCGFLSVALTVPVLVAVPLGLAVRHMSEHDLTAMRWGQMDPDGRRYTVLAQLWGGAAIFLSLFCWVPVAVWFLLRH